MFSSKLHVLHLRTWLFAVSLLFLEKALDGNQWIYDMTGTLQHCVAILKLCHATTEKLSAEPLSSVGAPLNTAILMATNRIMPNFNQLIQTMEANRVGFYIF